MYGFCFFALSIYFIDFPSFDLVKVTRGGAAHFSLFTSTFDSEVMDGLRLFFFFLEQQD